MKLNLIVVSILLSCILFSACGPSDEEKREMIKQAQIQLIHQLEQDRKNRLSEFNAAISGKLLLGTILYISFAFIGPFFIEKIRTIVTNSFHVSINTQVNLSIIFYISIIGFILWFAYANQIFESNFLSVLLLTSATIYPFFVNYLPGLKNGNSDQRKAALIQIKSFLFLILVIYVVLKFLSPEGFAGMQLK